MTFNNDVYALCSKIPEGKVSTYGEIARALGTKAHRAVGNALNRNPHAPKVPCHRVVKSTGEIGGFASGTRKKEELLKREGVKVENGKIKDFEAVLYRF